MSQPEEEPGYSRMQVQSVITALMLSVANMDMKFIPQSFQNARQSRLPTRCASIKADVLNTRSH